ncbi:MAG: HD domain-containing phosphohydrolase [Planctomycetota bacterium]
MIDDYEDLNRVRINIIVLHDAPSCREFYKLSLRHAGFERVKTYSATPKALEQFVNSDEEHRADLLLYGILPESEISWENLHQIRKLYDGPVLVATERHDEQVEKRIRELSVSESGVSDYMSVGEFGEECLRLKVETMLTACRINSLISENDLRTQRLFVNILSVMVKILENKDSYTKFHSHSVAKWSRMIGRRMGICGEDLDNLGLAAVFHDFGKIGIPEDILCKASPLTQEEFAIMKQHPLIARDLLSSLDLLSNLLPAITHHHERWNGDGYPDGLKGEQTPLWARIIALADAYDTMSSRRAYKKAYNREIIQKELDACRGVQFDPVLVDHLTAILKEHR